MFSAFFAALLCVLCGLVCETLKLLTAEYAEVAKRNLVQSKEDIGRKQRREDVVAESAGLPSARAFDRIDSLLPEVFSRKQSTCRTMNRKSS
jgi:hypothetical protein